MTMQIMAAFQNKMRINKIIKELLYYSGACTALRGARRSRFRGCRVINFHRLLADETRPDHYAALMNEATVSQLEALLRYLRRWFNFITPASYLESARRGRVDPFSLILTFDDGHVDLHDRLLPLLERLELPCTVFINTGAMNGEVLWFQRLFAALIRTPQESLSSHAGVARLPLVTVQERVAAITQLSRRQVHYSADEWPDVIDAVCHELRWDGQIGDEKMMDWDQLQTLAKSRWFTIGGHTVSHPYLPGCTPARLMEELVMCADELRSRLGLSFLPFSYPNGSSDARVVCAVEQSGYDCAFLMEPGLNTPGTPRFELFRQYIRANVVGGAFDISFRAG